MKRMWALILSGILLLGCLCGCREESTQPQEGETVEQPSKEASEQAGTQQEPEEEEEEEPQQLVPQIKMLVQEYGGGEDRYDGIVEIPVFSIGGSQADLEDFNRVMQEMADEYAQFKESTDFQQGYRWAEIKSYPRTDGQYVQVALTKNYYPTYGTMGEVYSCCFDLEEQRVLMLQDFYDRFGVTQEGLADLFRQTVGEPYEGDILVEFRPCAFLLLDDGGELYCRAFYENQESGNRDELYCYSTVTSTFQLLDGTRLTDASQLDEMSPPLSYGQETQTPEEYGITDNYLAAQQLLLEYVEPQLEEGETLSYINNGILVVDGVSCYMINLGAASETRLVSLGSFAVAEDLSCVYRVDPMTGEAMERLD